MTKRKLTIVSSVACGALIVAGVFGTEVFAGTSNSTSDTTTSTGKTTTIHHPAISVVNKSISSLATYLSTTKEQLRKDLKGGQSLNEIAAKHNISQSDLQSKLKSLVHNALEQQVTDGKLSQVRETTVEKNIDARLPQIAKNTHILPQDRIFHAKVDWMTQVAGDLRLTVPQLKADLKSGQSITQIAQKQGISITTLTSQLDSSVDGKVNNQISKLMSKTDWFTKKPSGQTSSTENNNSVTVSTNS